MIPFSLKVFATAEADSTEVVIWTDSLSKVNALPKLSASFICFGEEFNSLLEEQYVLVKC